MSVRLYIESLCALIFIFLINDVINATSSNDLTGQTSSIWNVLHSRHRRATDFKTDVNLTLSEKQSNYSIDTSKGIEFTPVSGKTQCFNESYTATNGTLYCPRLGDPKTFTSCCGKQTNQYCCKPVVAGTDPKQDVTLDLITALSIVIGFIVAISCCLLLYCCCCQKRSGVHSGKLVWIKRKKSGNKTVYTTSENPDLEDDQEGTELVGFMEQKENDTAGSRRGSVDDSKPSSRRGSKLSLDHKPDHHGSDPDGVANHSPVPVVKHVTPSGQVLMVPLINIQGSTPGTSPS